MPQLNEIEDTGSLPRMISSASKPIMLLFTQQQQYPATVGVPTPKVFEEKAACRTPSELPHSNFFSLRDK